MSDLGRSDEAGPETVGRTASFPGSLRTGELTMTTVQNDEVGNRYTIQSVDVALHVLQKMADHGKPLTLSEISNEPASKLHRYLSTFGLMDFVVQNQKHGT